VFSALNSPEENPRTSAVQMRAGTQVTNRLTLS
jgi:hypothetical protein